MNANQNLEWIKRNFKSSIAETVSLLSAAVDGVCSERS